MLSVNWSGLWDSFTTFWLPIIGWVVLIIAIFVVVKIVKNRRNK